ncbi:YdcF family protein [Siccirubricoccus phaeus]|uniref:YdcF family protein n=1 Tax=Siccirubricoccus phaeus TaxID=2595053 RepID=UPI0011F188AB|nr:YdcF family protein [Siccirubricoccus phaeus]
MQGTLTSLLLPPLLLVLVALLGGLGRRRGLVALAALLLLFLATPLCAGLLYASLEREVRVGEPYPAAGAPPGAVIVLSGEAARTRDGAEVGPLTLERLRAGAALARRTGLPLLVTGGALGRGEPPIAGVMAAALREEFGVPVRWVEDRARDTRENAAFSAELLRAEGIGTAWLVTHAWHMPRSQEAFARAGLVTLAAPVRLDRVPDGRLSDWVPRPDRWAQSWYALREWAGRAVYRLRDG